MLVRNSELLVGSVSGSFKSSVRLCTVWCLEDYRELAVTQEKVDKRSKCGGLGVAAMDGPYFMLRLDLVHYYYLLISQKE